VVFTRGDAIALIAARPPQDVTTRRHERSWPCAASVRGPRSCALCTARTRLHDTAWPCRDPWRDDLSPPIVRSSLPPRMRPFGSRVISSSGLAWCHVDTRIDYRLACRDNCHRPYLQL